VSIIIKVFLYIGFLYISAMTSAVKTSFVLPEPLYRELKRRALEEGRTVKEVVIEAIMNYLSANRSRRKDLVELLLKPALGAGPEDMKEIEYNDLGE